MSPLCWAKCQCSVETWIQDSFEELGFGCDKKKNSPVSNYVSRDKKKERRWGKIENK